MSELREPVMRVEDIQKILPHRYPFLLVDRVIEIKEADQENTRVGRQVTAIKNVTANEPFFNGHFPHRPVMPGVLIIEAMAQAGALGCYLPDDEEMDVAIAHIKDAKFRKPVVPGDTLKLTAVVHKDRGKMIVLLCKAFVEDQLVAQAEIMAYVIPKSQLDH